MSPSVAVTGASGFVGRALCEHLAARGWEVRALVRRPESFPALDVPITAYRCELPGDIDPAALEGVDAVVHCAWDTRPRSTEEADAVNRDGTERVHELARAAGVRRFVFLSSLAAHEGALSEYGRTKLALEHGLDLSRDAVIRAGLVIGPGEGGLFGRMVDSMRRTRLVPLVDGGRQILQTVYIDDLCDGIEAAIRSEAGGRWVVAEPDGLSARDFFSLLAEQLQIRCLRVPVPGSALATGLRAAERLGLRLPISSENVLGFMSMRHQDSAADLAALGIEVRPARDALRLTLEPRWTRPAG